jgi:hypothetical protein
MRSGEGPANPRAYCRSKDSGVAPRTADIRVVWLAEGDGVAVFERDTIVAIIPPWSGSGGFHGYARDAIGEGPVAWELREDNALLARFADAARYWASWDEPDTWGVASDHLLAHYEQALGSYANYYAVDGGYWPPRAVLRIPVAEGVALVTVGMSLLPQPIPDDATESSCVRHVELGVVLPSRCDDAAIKRFAAYLGAQSTLPWARYTWLGHGHTLPCDAWQSAAFSSVVFSTEHPAVPTVNLGRVLGASPAVLWMLPLSPSERELAVSAGSAHVLKRLPRERWREA